MEFEHKNIYFFGTDGLLKNFDRPTTVFSFTAQSIGETRMPNREDLNEFSRLVEACVIAARRIKTSTQIIDTTELFRSTNIDDPNTHINGIYRTHFDERDADRMIEEQWRGCDRILA